MITYTHRAFERLVDMLTEPMESNNKSRIRFGVEGAGCSGYMYTLEIVDGTLDTDLSFGPIVVSPEALELLTGTEIDYVKEGLNEVFRFNNPNAEASCGCGESFTIKEK